MSKLDPVISIRVTDDQKGNYNGDPIKGKLVRDTVRDILDGKSKVISHKPDVEMIGSYLKHDFTSPLLDSEWIVVISYDIYAFIKAPGVLSALRQRALASVYTYIFIPVIGSLSPAQELGLSTLQANLSRYPLDEGPEKHFGIYCFYPSELTASRFVFFDGSSMITALPAIHNNDDQIDYRCVRFPCDTADPLFTDLIRIPLLVRCDSNLMRTWTEDSAP